MGGFVKVYDSIRSSSLWTQPPATRIVWLTLLTAKDRHGEIEASLPGLAMMANVSLQEAEAAILYLESPDPHSRDQEHEGRRVERLEDGRGWRVLNAAKFGEKRQEDRRREWRERKREERRRRREDEARLGPVLPFPSEPKRGPEIGTLSAREGPPAGKGDVTPKAGHVPRRAGHCHEIGGRCHTDIDVDQVHQPRRAVPATARTPDEPAPASTARHGTAVGEEIDWEALAARFPGVDLGNQYRRLRERIGQRPSARRFLGWLAKAQPEIGLRPPRPATRKPAGGAVRPQVAPDPVPKGEFSRAAARLARSAEVASTRREPGPHG